MKRELDSIANKHSLETYKLDNYYFGTINSYHIYLKLHENTVIINFPYQNIDESIKEIVTNRFKDLMDERPKGERFRLSKPRLNKNGFTIQILGKKKNLNSDNIMLIVDLITNSFNELKVSKEDYCLVCHNRTEQYAFLNEKLVPYCESCSVNLTNGKPRNEIYQFFTGPIGAILGAIVGIIPYLFIAFRFYYLIGVLAFLPAFASIKLYGLFKGPKISWYAKFFVMLPTIIVLGYPSFWLLLSSPEDAVFTFLFGIMGLFYAMREIKKYTDHSEPIILN